MFFCVLLCSLPCMELLLLLLAATAAAATPPYAATTATPPPFAVVVMENSKMYSPTASRTLVGQQVRTQ